MREIWRSEKRENSGSVCLMGMTTATPNNIQALHDTLGGSHCWGGLVEKEPRPLTRDRLGFGSSSATY